MRDVRSPTAGSHASADGAWPPSWRQGRKWSETQALSRPICSASTANSTRSLGPNCSADALYPIFTVTSPSLPAIGCRDPRLDPGHELLDQAVDDVRQLQIGQVSGPG